MLETLALTAGLAALLPSCGKWTGEEQKNEGKDSVQATLRTSTPRGPLSGPSATQPQRHQTATYAHDAKGAYLPAWMVEKEVALAISPPCRSQTGDRLIKI